MLLTAVGFIPNDAFQNDACTLIERKGEKNGTNEYMIERKLDLTKNNIRAHTDQVDQVQLLNQQKLFRHKHRFCLMMTDFEENKINKSITDSYQKKITNLHLNHLV